MAKRSKPKPIVQILMATYNGIQYLPQQVKSLTEQSAVEIEIHVQDDGSTDGTLQYIEELFSLGIISRLTTSKNIGSTSVYFEMIKNSSLADYYAFCDQDDIWNPEKLKFLINELSDNAPEMVFCTRRPFSANKKILKAKRVSKKKIGIRNALIENSAPGNTILLNYKGMQLLKQINLAGAKHYDAVIYLFFSCLGKIKFLNLNLVNYRIHEKNQVGYGGNFICKLIQIKNQLKQYEINAKILRENTNYINPDALNVIENFLKLDKKEGILNRFIILLKLKLVRNSFFETLIFNLYLLAKK